MTTRDLPPRPQLVRAFIRRNRAFDGVFFAAVRTTRIFCRPGCPARPNPSNVEFYRTTGEAIAAGYRPCKRCHPLGPPAEISALPEVVAERFGASSAAEVRDVTCIAVARIDTPLGGMVAAATEERLLLLEFADRRMLRTQLGRVARRVPGAFAPGETAITKALRPQLDEYFRGRRWTFDVPLYQPGTPFQVLAWNALQEIPAGTTRSYAAMAATIGRPDAVRAVARANGDNGIAILIPCHRVVGSDGRLVGYGGGVWRKQRLLELEGRGTGHLKLEPPR
jgi:O-6-methylguanine DNA methyltransferase